MIPGRRHILKRVSRQSLPEWVNGAIGYWTYVEGVDEPIPTKLMYITEYHRNEIENETLIQLPSGETAFVED